MLRKPSAILEVKVVKENIRAVFCYLANRGARNYIYLFISVFLLKKNLLKKKKYDVIVFHEANYSKIVRSVLVFLFDVRLREINLLEQYLKNIAQISIDPELKAYSAGYRSMCHFFFEGFYKHIKEYDYYCRLDTDSFLIGAIDFDPFEYMKKNKLLYGYIAELYESANAIKGIDNYLQENVEKLDEKVRGNILFNGSAYNLRCIYTNFEIIDLSMFDKPEVKTYIDGIVKSNNIFNYRWGDAPLRTIMLSLFVDKNQIVRFKMIDYKHQLFVQKKGHILYVNNIRQELYANPIAGVIC